MGSYSNTNQQQRIVGDDSDARRRRRRKGSSGSSGDDDDDGGGDGRGGSIGRLFRGKPGFRQTFFLLFVGIIELPLYLSTDMTSKTFFK